MELTPERKQTIDNMPYKELLCEWRYAAMGDVWFQGETGKYWAERLGTLRSEPGGQERHVAASKAIS